MRFRLHRTTGRLRRAASPHRAGLLAECIDELNLIADHRRNAEGQFALID